jgi:hypothetical protein
MDMIDGVIRGQGELNNMTGRDLIKLQCQIFRFHSDKE